jgi:hypothetical protein
MSSTHHETLATTDRLSVEDRLDIQELFARYAWGLNTGDIDAVLACFTEDGALEHPPQGRCQGRDAIRELLEELWYGRPGWFIGRQHLANHFLITAEGEGARVKAFFSILQYQSDYESHFVFGLGNWDNYCVKRDGRWLFQTLTVHPWNKRRAPWVGEDRAKSYTYDRPW